MQDSPLTYFPGILVVNFLSSGNSKNALQYFCSCLLRFPSSAYLAKFFAYLVAKFGTFFKKMSYVCHKIHAYHRSDKGFISPVFKVSIKPSHVK